MKTLWVGMANGTYRVDSSCLSDELVTRLVDESNEIN